MNRFRRLLGRGALALGFLAVGPCDVFDPSPDDCEQMQEWRDNLVLFLETGLSEGYTDDEAEDARDLAAIDRKVEQACDNATTTTSTSTTTTSTTTSSTSTSTTSSTSSTTTTTPTHTHPGLHVDPEDLMVRPPGLASTTFELQNTGATGSGPSDVAAFRTNCRFSHNAWDDPLVAPGNPGGAHLHTFFGATNVDAFSTTASILASPGSTCDGGLHNRTAYWVPTMVDTARGNEPVRSFLGGYPERSVYYGDVGGRYGFQVYYKSGYQGVPATSITQWFPEGLRMIAGDMTRTAPRDTSNPIVHYRCTFPGDQGGAIGSQNIPACPPGQRLDMTVRFPQCWVGPAGDNPATPANEALWRADQSHMAYGLGWPDQGCPTSHPVPLPEVQYQVRWFIQPGQNASTFRLVSDTYTGPAGYSGHADWWNGWDPAIGDRIIANCYQQPPTGRDCQFSLGDGWEPWWDGPG